MIPKNFTVADIDELLEARKYIFSGKPYPLKIYSQEIKKILVKSDWKNGSDLVADIQKITNTDSLEKADKILGVWKEEVSQKTIESTILQPQELEKLKQDAERSKLEREKSRDIAKKQVQEKKAQWTRLQKEKQFEVAPKENQVKILESLKGKVVYVVPEEKEIEVKLSEQEEAFLNLAKQNPEVFEEKLAEEIIKKNPQLFQEEDIKPLADIISADTIKIILNSEEKPVPTGVFAALSGYKDSEEIQKTSAIFTTLNENKENLYREILNKTIGTNLSNKILGYPERIYKLSFIQPENLEGVFSIRLDDLQRNSFNFQESQDFKILNNPLLDEARSAVSGQLKNFAASKISSLPRSGLLGKFSRLTTTASFDSIAPFLGIPTQATYTSTSFFGKMITTFLPKYAPLITNLSTKLGIDIGIKAIAPAAEKAISAGIENLTGKALTKAGAAVAAKTGLAATFSAIGAKLGSFAPVVGNIVGAILGWLLGKIIDWVKKHKDDLKTFGLIILGGGFIVQSLPIIVIGTVIFIPSVLATGFSLGAVAGKTALFFGRLGASLAITIGTPIIVSIVVFPILVAIILFIINSGAYLVPPKSNVGTPGECMGDIAIKPDATGIMYSPDNKYAYPVAPSNSVGESCTHWDKSLATDIFPADKHVPVIAYTSGSVEGISTTDSKGGKYIILAGNDGRYYYYAHNCALFVEEGDSVFAGDVIATTDQSGSAADTAEHLHFAISSAPNFIGGGTVCPSQDFADKFPGYNKCEPEEMCIP